MYHFPPQLWNKSFLSTKWYSLELSLVVASKCSLLEVRPYDIVTIAMMTSTINSSVLFISVETFQLSYQVSQFSDHDLKYYHLSRNVSGTFFQWYESFFFIPNLHTTISYTFFTTDVISGCKLYQLTTTGVKFVAYRLSLKITDVWSLARWLNWSMISKDNSLIRITWCANSQNGQLLERTSHGLDNSWIRQHINTHQQSMKVKKKKKRHTIIIYKVFFIHINIM